MKPFRVESKNFHTGPKVYQTWVRFPDTIVLYIQEEGFPRHEPFGYSASSLEKTFKGPFFAE